MFDWNDEELTTIIWGEAGESDDHIVPYPDESEEKSPGVYGNNIKKEGNVDATNFKVVEQNKISQTDLEGRKLDSSSEQGTNESASATGFAMESWPDLSLSNAAKVDQGPMGIEASKNLTEISRNDSSKDETAPEDTTSEIFQNQQEDREQSDFVDYSWATIGSFDDLDRIFSNDDPIFGHTTLGNTDEIWSSPKDVTSSLERSIPFSSASLGLGELRSTSEQLEIKECMLDQDESFAPVYDQVSDVTSNGTENVQAGIDTGEYSSKDKLLTKGKPTLRISENAPVCSPQSDVGNVAITNESNGKGNRQKRISKGRNKAEEKSEVRELHEFSSIWSSSANQFQQFDGQYVPPMNQTCPTLVLPQQRQQRGPESLQYKHFSGPVLASSMYGNMANQYPLIPVLSQFRLEEGNQQQVPFNYEISAGSPDPHIKSPDGPANIPTMTPQEKIEKLRRRQQMRALIAIQRQQLQFNNQVSSTEQFVAEGGTSDAEENINLLPSFDPNSPIEQDDSSTVYMAIANSSLEDSILHRLQDIIAKLDVRIRLSIRDSLFRLAQSATQRQCASDTSSTNKSSGDEVVGKEETNDHSRFARIPDAETETNPIDRTVARLLFHRPMELSVKLTELPESPLSAKLPFEKKAPRSVSLSPRFRPQRSESMQKIGTKAPCSFPVGDQAKSVSCFDTSENASINQADDSGVKESEASQ